MYVKLLSCTAARPDRRAISNSLATIATQGNQSLAAELTEILLEGDEVEIEIKDKNTASALRTLRKLELDYEIID